MQQALLPTELSPQTLNTFNREKVTFVFVRNSPMPASLWNGRKAAQQSSGKPAVSVWSQAGQSWDHGCFVKSQIGDWRRQGLTNTKRCFIHNDIQVGNRKFVDLPLEGFFVSTGSGPGSGEAMGH